MTSKSFKHDAPCGLVCSECEYLGEQCNGCVDCSGKPFWAKDKPCPIYDCCVNTKKFSHCGECKELPCKIFEDLRDPQLSDEEFRKQKEDRKKRLLERLGEN